MNKFNINDGKNDYFIYDNELITNPINDFNVYLNQIILKFIVVNNSCTYRIKQHTHTQEKLIN